MNQETPPSRDKSICCPGGWCVYYHTFQDGSTGMGLDDVPGRSVGTVVTVVEGSQAYDSGCIRVGDTVEAVGDTDVSSMNEAMVKN